MRLIILSLVVVALAQDLVLAYPAEPEIKFSTTTAPDIDPDHVPSSVCVSMMPNHGPNQPSNKEPPYVIDVSPKKIPRGETVEIVIKVNGSSGFKGVYIQGRINDKPVGRWIDQREPQINISDCPPGKDNALSYVSRNTALPYLRLYWDAPKDITGSLVFQATIVKSYSEFWVNVKSSPLEVV